MGTHYLRCFIGGEWDIDTWLDEKIDMWVAVIRFLPNVAGTYAQ
jgi:hypothetical protein